MKFPENRFLLASLSRVPETDEVNLLEITNHGTATTERASCVVPNSRKLKYGTTFPALRCEVLANKLLWRVATGFTFYQA